MGVGILDLKTLVILIIILSTVSTAGCCCGNIPIYVPTDQVFGDIGPRKDVRIEYEQVSRQETDASNLTLTKVADAIDANDKNAFLGLMSSATLRGMDGEPDLATAEAAKIAGALRQARLTRPGHTMMDYEISVDGAVYSIGTVKEDGKWKLAGF